MLASRSISWASIRRFFQGQENFIFSVDLLDRICFISAASCSASSRSAMVVTKGPVKREKEPPEGRGELGAERYGSGKSSGLGS